MAGGLDGVIVHIHHFGTGNDLEGGKVDLVLGGTVLDGLFIAQQRQRHAVAEFGRSLGRALEHTQRGVVAAHGVNQNFHCTSSCTQACMACCAVSERAA